MHEQIIYFGAPGTGKSFLIKDKLSGVSSSKIFRVTIHQEFTYSDFVGQLLPDSSAGGVTFPFVAGPFTRALAEAYADSSEDVYLVLEELSRGNVAAIFGDIFQLLDRDAHFVSRYPIRNENIAAQIPCLRGDEIVLPSNFNILCTVNMNDQNVFPMDTAFKRRFDWEYVSARPVMDGAGVRISTLNNPRVDIAVDSLRSNDCQTTWHAFYMALNCFITDKQKGLGKSEDKQVGQFFVDFGPALTSDSHSSTASVAEAARERVNRLLRNKLLLYLWQDVQGSATFLGKVKMFDDAVNSYDDLYMKFGNDRVFSEVFLQEFLIPAAGAYPY